MKTSPNSMVDALLNLAIYMFGGLFISYLLLGIGNIYFFQGHGTTHFVLSSISLCVAMPAFPAKAARNAGKACGRVYIATFVTMVVITMIFWAIMMQ